MTLRFSWEWESAPRVRTPELSATWSRLGIEVAGVTATLVEERVAGHGIRKTLDVPAYPLAEWIAFRWWAAVAPTARQTGGGVRLQEAEDGFPWPDLTLLPGPGYTAATLRRSDKNPHFVRFLSAVDAVLDYESTVYEMARFVDATVRRLDDAGIRDTRLQTEWSAITSTEGSEREFCLAAAALGLDPYDMTELQEHDLLNAGESSMDPSLLLDLAATVDLAALPAAQAWVSDALGRLEHTEAPPLAIMTEPLPFGERVPPWQLGYERARSLRKHLSTAPLERLEVADLVGLTSVEQAAPAAIGGLVAAHENATTVAIGGATSRRSGRFLSARALGRRTFDSRLGEIVLTSTRRQYGEKVERAFAAEFLAPADGIAELLGDDASDSAIIRAANHFEVDQLVIEHQLENQVVGS